MQLKTCESFISGIFHLILLDHSWLDVTKNLAKKTKIKERLHAQSIVGLWMLRSSPACLEGSCRRERPAIVFMEHLFHLAPVAPHLQVHHRKVEAGGTMPSSHGYMQGCWCVAYSIRDTAGVHVAVMVHTLTQHLAPEGAQGLTLLVSHCGPVYYICRHRLLVPSHFTLLQHERGKTLQLELLGRRPRWDLKSAPSIWQQEDGLFPLPNSGIQLIDHLAKPREPAQRLKVAWCYSLNPPLPLQASDWNWISYVGVSGGRV